MKINKIHFLLVLQDFLFSHSHTFLTMLYWTIMTHWNVFFFLLFHSWIWLLAEKNQSNLMRMWTIFQNFLVFYCFFMLSFILFHSGNENSNIILKFKTTYFHFIQKMIEMLLLRIPEFLKWRRKVLQAIETKGIYTLKWLTEQYEKKTCWNFKVFHLLQSTQFDEQ